MANSCWTLEGRPDICVTHFLCLSERERLVVVAGHQDGEYGVYAVPLQSLVRVNAAGRITPWSADEVFEQSHLVIGQDNHLVDRNPREATP
jgi:hypothetical protein